MTTVEQVREVLERVPDPEIPVLTLADLGVLRDVEVDGEDVVVTITPTYSGCPAMDEIRADVERVLRERGWRPTVRTVLSPAWTTDWMSEDGRRKLREYGVAPPGLLSVRPYVPCPQCGSGDTEELSRFGSTACQAMWRCRSCREPFDHFRAH